MFDVEKQRPAEGLSKVTFCNEDIFRGCSVRKVKTSVENVVQRSEEGLSDGTGGNKHFTQLIMNSRWIRREFQFLLQILKSRVSKQDGERHEHMNFTYYFGRSTC